MARTSGRPTVITQEYEFPIFKSEKCIIVPVPTWQHLMSRLEQCGDSSPTYESIGWACVGVLASAVLAAITFPFSVKFSESVADGGTTANIAAIVTEVGCIALGLAAAGIGATSFKFSRQHRADRETLRQTITDDMRHIAERHHGTEDHMGATQPSEGMAKGDLPTNLALCPPTSH